MYLIWKREFGSGREIQVNYLNWRTQMGETAGWEHFGSGALGTALEAKKTHPIILAYNSGTHTRCWECCGKMNVVRVEPLIGSVYLDVRFSWKEKRWSFFFFFSSAQYVAPKSYPNCSVLYQAAE